MVPFGGWDMPVQYPNGIIHEVNQVRNNVGIFDVSHMARFGFGSDMSTGEAAALDEAIGSDPAAQFLDSVLSVKASGLREWQARYHVICDENGGIIDDAIVYKIPNAEVAFGGSEEQPQSPAKQSRHWYLLVVNAGNADTDREWIAVRLGERGCVVFQDISDQTAMVAVQGPNAVKMIDEISGGDAGAIRRFHSGMLHLGDIAVLATRTGYTGEDGFEVICHERFSADLWEMLVKHGAAPCGLGARDVLRLEAGLMLHGSDMTIENDPYEAGLAWTVKNDSTDYVAGNAFRRIKDAGTKRRIVGFEMKGRGIARPDHLIFDGDKEIGIVTSGTMSPTLGKAIGIGYVPTEMAKPGTAISIEIRGRKIDAEVVKLPFYRRSA